jgi:hypothetical protein
MLVERIITGLMLVVAAVHLAPISGFFGARRLEALYGIDASDPNLALLMRHRAVLFGILGSFFAYAAFVPALQPLAFMAAAVTLTAFFYLALAADEVSPAIRKIVIGDVVAAIALIGAVVLHTTK